MTTRTKVAMTTEETSPGVPLWGINTITTTLPLGQNDIAIENLIAGKRYYVKVWNEDDFGNKSPERLRVIDVPSNQIILPVAFSANGYFDDGSPMRAYVKVPEGTNVVGAKITLAFRQFMAPSRSAASSGILTSDTGGGSTTPAGGASTSGSGGGSTSGNGGTHSHVWAQWVSNTPSATATNQKHQDGAASTNKFNLPAEGSGNNFATQTTSDHTHTTPNHTHTTPDHTHATPDHAHTVPGHTHALVYGTFEEAYPASHLVHLRVFVRSGGTTWQSVNDFIGFTGDLVDFDLSSVINRPGDWRIEVMSELGQPNNGRLGCDLYGTISVAI